MPDLSVNNTVVAGVGKVIKCQSCSGIVLISSSNFTYTVQLIFKDMTIAMYPDKVELYFKDMKMAIPHNPDEVAISFLTNQRKKITYNKNKICLSLSDCLLYYL